MRDYTCLSALEMAELVRLREVSPVDLVEEHLARIEKLNPRLNAFVQVDGERARRDARAAEWAVKNGAGLGPLNGVPLGIKSSIDVAGLRCEAGSKLRNGYVALQDAPLVARLRAAGAIVLGVTNTPDAAVSLTASGILLSS